MLQRIAQQTGRLRASRRQTNAAASIYEATYDIQSLDCIDTTSTIGGSEFEFDDIIVNSTVYRRAMAAKSAISSRSETKKQEATAHEDEGLILQQ